MTKKHPSVPCHDKNNGTSDQDNHGGKPSAARLQKKLSDLHTKLHNSPLSHGTKDEKHDAQTTKGTGFILRLGFELVIAVVIGTGMGWYLDQWMNSLPLFLLIFFCLGLVAGFMNITRAMKHFNTQG